MSGAEVITKAVKQVTVTEATESGRVTIQSTRHTVTAEKYEAGWGQGLKQPVFNWLAKDKYNELGAI